MSIPAKDPGFEIGDIYYLLFRHKWKILVCAALGFLAAVGVYKQQPPAYRSQAKLFIRFVISEGRSTDLTRDDAVALSPEARGATVIQSELQILTSRDLSEIVAKAIGPEKVLAKISGNKSLDEAASVIRSGLTVDVPRGTSILLLVFEHPDVEIVQPVLREIVTAYLKRHHEIHRAGGMVDEFLSQETDSLRQRLAQTEEEIRKVNNRLGIVSFETSKQSYATQIAKFREQIFEAQIQLAELTSLQDQVSQRSSRVNSDTSASSPERAPAEKIDAYQKLGLNLAQLRQKEQELLTQFTEEVPRVKDIRAQLSGVEQQKKKLEAEFPSLLDINYLPRISANGATKSAADSIAEAAKIVALKARLSSLNENLDKVRKEASQLDAQEVTISELNRKKSLEEGNYTRYAASLENARIKQAMGDGRVTNITEIERPTPPFRDWTQLRKLVAGIGVGGIAVGLAWAALIEFFLDRSVRRPADIERSLHLPLFLSIPQLKMLGRGKTPKTALPAIASTSTSNNALQVKNSKPSELEAFHQTLRDRLISYFESINLRHKPKLVAVTGLGRGSGVTTTAAGLAKTLSETGEGNVLLVDMTQGQGSAQQFHKGSQVELEQLFSTRNSAFVQSNLYVVSEHSGSERLARGMPQRFNELMPKLKASDFDYIIFDMPAVNQISITPRLASFMDMVLMVVESEKTDRAMAERAASLLSQSKTNVAVVLNKTRTYVPAKLHQDRDLLGI